MSEKKTARGYMLTVIVLGSLSLIAAFVRMPVQRIDVYLPIIAVLTVLIGSRITIPIPRFKSHIAVSDTFIFFTFLLYGGEFAIILSAIEAFASSWRFCNRRITVFFNAAAVAISTSSVVGVLEIAGLNTESYLHGKPDSLTNFVIILSVLALVQFSVNTGLAAVYDSLKDSLPLWETWKSKYIWTFFSYFIGAIGAGVLVQLSGSAGIGVIFATFPVILFVFLCYRMYMRNIEISIKQAEQAEQYARVLETQAEALRESEERFRSAFDHAPIGIGLLSPSGAWLRVNQAMTGILGYSEEEFLRMDFQAITLPEDLGRCLTKVHELLSGSIASSQMEQRYVHKSGRIVWTSWSVSAAQDHSSRQPSLIFQIQDITDKKSAEQKLQHEATHDVLTSLPNRLYFMGRLAGALERTHTIQGYKASVLFIDLDRFKNVNDSLGHLCGDQLLKGIATRLGECLRPADTIARLGGDEFTILVEGKYDLKEVTRIAERIQEKFKMPFDLNGHEVYSSASIGILHASRAHRSSEDVMRDADTAMYQAKRAGKACHKVFNDAMHSHAKETLKLETELRHAVERDEIGVFYQPIYDLGSGLVESVEALARWDHPELGQTSPSKFIPLAEEIGVIDRLCEQVLRRACREAGSLSVNGRRMNIGINLSCRQFGRASLAREIHEILDETGLHPSNLRLEITESVFFEHQDRAIGMLNQLRHHGIGIDIDDFGTGYCNLGYLKRLPVTALKIDRTFVAMIDGEGNDEIVRAIITLAHNLGLKVVAEGVENEVQLEVLRSLDCERAQGFLFAKPMSFDDLTAFFDRDSLGPMPRENFDNTHLLPLIQ